MLQHPRRPRLLLEAPHAVVILREFRGQNLDRHLAPDASVARAKDFTHTAGAERAGDLVRTEAGAGCEGHVARDGSIMARVVVHSNGHAVRRSMTCALLLTGLRHRL
jgi:hypothetical protein